MGKVETLEPRVHGRGRQGERESRFGVHQQMVYAKMNPAGGWGSMDWCGHVCGHRHVGERSGGWGDLCAE